MKEMKIEEKNTLNFQKGKKLMGLWKSEIEHILIWKNQKM